MSLALSAEVKRDDSTEKLLKNPVTFLLKKNKLCSVILDYVSPWRVMHRSRVWLTITTPSDPTGQVGQLVIDNYTY